VTLEGAPPPAALPGVRVRAPGLPHRPLRVELDLGPGSAEDLAERARAAGVDAAALLVALLGVQLVRTGAPADLVVGVHLAGGWTAVRLDLAGEPGLGQLARRVADALVRAEASAGRLPELAAALGKRAGELFQVAIAPLFEPGPLPEPIDAVLRVVRRGAGLALVLECDGEAHDADEAARSLGHFATLVRETAGGLGTSIAELPLLSPEERARILDRWNDTAIDFPRDATLHGLFEARADGTPGAIAATFGERELTYRELDERANRLAHHLRELGVGPDVLVGISVERSLEMVVGLLAIAKAGGAYLPMDPAYPTERIALMLEDSGVGVVLTQKRLLPALPPTSARVVELDTERPPWADAPAGRPESGATAESLAYAIYTSGSTGKPKGVLLDHRGRVNNFLDFNRRFSVGAGDALIALASLSFDMCAYDVFGTLAAGATIALPQPGEMQDPPSWARLMRERGVTIWHTAPAMLKMLVDHLEEHPAETPSSLRLVLLGGDWIPVTLPDRLRALVPGARVVSMGGATEVSMDSTIYVIDEVDPAWTSIPYGEPMKNQLAYVLDARLQPVPIGVPGELFLGGVGVGRGYLNRPELTAQRFLENPFVDEPGARMYRTGDLARWMPDGNLELLGRIDNQVKIRGHRIELGEIEARLRKHPGVKEGVVVARADAGGEKRLVAYVVQDPAWKGAEDARLDVEQVGDWAAVYDDAYAANAAAVAADEATFNVVSWNSSYTKQPIPAEEMRVWTDQTVERIRAHRPDRVLEIGSGMGLLLFPIAPECSLYRGLDISRVAVEYVRRHAESLGLPQVKVEQRAAHELGGIEAGSFDAVVLNSIVVDFPDMEYLERVLEGAVAAVRPGGVVFVGDVRHLSLSETFQASVQLRQADDDAPAAQVAARVQRLVKQEEELLVHPAFFHWLRTKLPEIGAVRVELRRGRVTNEMNAFRYDVTLFVGAVPHDRAAPTWTDWQAGGLHLATLRARLTKEERVLLRGIPNARTARDARAAAALRAAPAGTTVAELRRDLSDEGVHPEDVWALAHELGFHAELRWSDGDPRTADGSGRFDAALRRKGSPDEPAPPTLFPADLEVDGARAADDFGSNPLMDKLARRLGAELRHHLAAALPEAMVPSAYVRLDALPLSPNGKVDRKALPEPDTTRPDMDAPFVAPETPVERVICEIWTEVLGLDRVGIDDPFLDLGGHSLLGVQIQSRLREILAIDVSLPDLFETRTPASLAARLVERGGRNGIDVEEICRILLEIDALSDEEVAAAIGDREND